MDQGPLLHHQLPIQPDYSIPPENDCIDQFSGHAHHPSFPGVAAVDQLRRDGNLPQHNPAPFNFATTENSQVRYMTDRAVAPDASSYRPANHFTDSSSGSISTSPSSAASSLAFPNYPANHYTSEPFATSMQHHQAFPYATSRIDSATSGMPPPSFRNTISTTALHTGDREAYTTNSSFAARPRTAPNTQAGYSQFPPDTPRSVISGLAYTTSPASAYMSSAGGGYGSGSSQSDCGNFPWPGLEVLLDMTSEGQAVTPEVHAKVEKGFFLSPADQKWTCYRRNYFSVMCSFELHPNINNGRLFLKRNNNSEQIQAMGMRLSAAVDGSGGKNIELIQHTPKRDNGPKTKIDVTKVSPTPSTGRAEHTVSPHGIYQVPMSTFHPTGAVPGPFLPLQNAGEANGVSSSNTQAPQLSAQFAYPSSSGQHLPLPGQNVSHTFERVQFKQATANNGKRRASQQYFHLIVELFADVRKDRSDTPNWVKIAQRVSEKIVVRGRSPSHYQNEGQNGQVGRGGSASGGNGYTSTAASYAGSNAGGFRSSVGGYSSGLGSSSGYRTNQYTLQPSPEGSGSSPDSVDEGAVDSEHPMDTAMTDAERNEIQNGDQYQYYPGPIYQGVPMQQTLPPLSKVESMGGPLTEPRQYAVKAEYADAVPGARWQIAGCGRFQGVESSRGYFPDLSASFN